MAQNQHPNPGNFANDRVKASQAGKTGGQRSGGKGSGGRSSHEEEPGAGSAQKGGQHKSGNFADDREIASEEERKGGSR